MTGTIDPAAEVNALTFVTRNEATNGKKGMVDRVFLTVTYSGQAAAPTITSTPITGAT